MGHGSAGISPTVSQERLQLWVHWQRRSDDGSYSPARKLRSGGRVPEESIRWRLAIRVGTSSLLRRDPGRLYMLLVYAVEQRTYSSAASALPCSTKGYFCSRGGCDWASCWGGDETRKLTKRWKRW